MYNHKYCEIYVATGVTHYKPHVEQHNLTEFLLQEI